MLHIHSHHFVCVFFLMFYFYFTELGTLAFTEEMTEVAQAPKDQDGSFFGKLCCKPPCQSHSMKKPHSKSSSKGAGGGCLAP